ncbi:MAG: hypothetical protein ACYDCI_05740 [Candidatus Limnocylindrales bacterium]
MAAGTSPIFEAAVRILGIQFTSADTTTKKSFGTIGANGTRIDSIMCSTSDTVAVNLAFAINDGTTDHYIGVVALPIGAGYTTVARVDAMATLSPVLGYLVIPSGYTLKAGCVATMSASVTTDAVGIGGDY